MVVDHLSRTAVTDDLQRRASDGTGQVANPCSVGRSPGLAPDRGLPSRHLSMPLVRSYRTLAPLPVPLGGHRRCVSVALSSRFPALGVTQQAWPFGSPDFPQPDHRTTSRAHSQRSGAGRDHLTCFPKRSLGCPSDQGKASGGDPGDTWLTAGFALHLLRLRLKCRRSTGL